MFEIFDSSAKIKQVYDTKNEKKAKETKYPWRELSVGKSFAVNDPNVKFNSLVTLAYKTSTRLKRKFIVIEHSPGVYEVARVADPVAEDKEPKTTFWTDDKKV